MTVIAAIITEDGGAVVAADSQTSKESGEKFPSPKLMRTRRGIAAAAGDAEAVAAFLDWQSRGGSMKERPRMHREWTWEGMLVTREKIIDFGGRPIAADDVKRPFHAIGIGADAAMAVMAYQIGQLLDLDPRAAVAAVCEVHTDCGLPVDFLTLRPRKGRP